MDRETEMENTSYQNDMHCIPTNLPALLLRLWLLLRLPALTTATLPSMEARSAKKAPASAIFAPAGGARQPRPREDRGRRLRLAAAR
jgi:hypothetical protein